jgi:hypothetical protein
MGHLTALGSDAAGAVKAARAALGASV